MPISVCIVEDDSGTGDALERLLRDEPNLRVLGRYRSGEEALRGIPRDAPDVVLMDIKLPGMSGIACVSALKDLVPAIQVLMLTTYEEADLIFDSLRAGACGYLLKKRVPEDLVRAVEEAHRGGAPMSMQIARKVVEHFRDRARARKDLESLTAREEEIVRLLATGHFDKEIAFRLGISVHTVRAHLRHIYEKLHVQSRTEAVVKFLETEPRPKDPRPPR